MFPNKIMRKTQGGGQTCFLILFLLVFKIFYLVSELLPQIILTKEKQKLMHYLRNKSFTIIQKYFENYRR